MPSVLQRNQIREVTELLKQRLLVKGELECRPGSQTWCSSHTNHVFGSLVQCEPLKVLLSDNRWFTATVQKSHWCFLSSYSQIQHTLTFPLFHVLECCPIFTKHASSLLFPIPRYFVFVVPGSWSLCALVFPSLVCRTSLSSDQSSSLLSGLSSAFQSQPTWLR